MNFKEFNTEYECSLLIESFDDELKVMIDTEALMPYKDAVEDIKQDIVKSFAPKLRDWALEVMAFSNELESGFEKLLNKIIDNSEKIARQLLDYSTDSKSNATPKYRIK